MPVLTVLECRLAGAMNLPPRAVRRLPLALALLWCNYAAQHDGMETWWCSGGAGRNDAAVDEKIRALRAGADDEGWAVDGEG